MRVILSDISIEQIIKFSGELSPGWPKVARRFLAEAIYGIQARQSVHLTEIARSLGGNDCTEEDSISAVSSVGTRGSWKESSQWALSDGSTASGEEDFVDHGYLRYQEKVCAEDGTFGPGSRRQ